MVNLIFRAEGVIVSPVKVHLAEYVVTVQRTASHSWMRLILHLNQNCGKIGIAENRHNIANKVSNINISYCRFSTSRKRILPFCSVLFKVPGYARMMTIDWSPYLMGLRKMVIQNELNQWL